jgi:predicted glycosyltransferase involved in capsule biosynthesis
MPESFSTGVFFMIGRDRFYKLGGFDESVHQSEDYLLSRKINKKRFSIINNHVGQDDRRYKKMGYFGMVKMVIKNWVNRNDIEHFRKNINYWK